MTSEFSQQRNHAFTYSTCSSISQQRELFFQNRSRELFPPVAASTFVKFKRNLYMCKSVIEILWDEVFMVRNTVKKGQSCCLAVICRKRSAFDRRFHLLVLSIFLKKKDRGDSSSNCQKERFDQYVSRRVLLAVLQTFWSTFTNQRIIFKPLGRFFKQFEILDFKHGFRRPKSQDY